MPVSNKRRGHGVLKKINGRPTTCPIVETPQGQQILFRTNGVVPVRSEDIETTGWSTSETSATHHQHQAAHIKNVCDLIPEDACA